MRLNYEVIILVLILILLVILGQRYRLTLKENQELRHQLEIFYDDPLSLKEKSYGK